MFGVNTVCERLFALRYLYCYYYSKELPSERIIMALIELTTKQREVFDFIAQHLSESALPPSVREIGSALGFSSPATVHNHITGLIDKGYLIRDPRKSRAIALSVEAAERFGYTYEPVSPKNVHETRSHLRLVEDAAVTPSSLFDKMVGDMIEAEDPAYSVGEVVAIPVMGDVAAGAPVLAVENIQSTYALPASLVKGDTFMLKVHGDSMIQAGILDGDLVIVRAQQGVDNGDIVVALLDDSTTVKRYFKEASHIRLQPENDAMEPILTQDVSVIGKVVGLLRTRI